MDQETQALETAAWAVAEGTATDAQLAVLEADPDAARRTFERLLDDIEDSLEAVRQTQGPERDMAVSDFEGERDRLEAGYALLTRSTEPPPDGASVEPVGEVRLQASWAGGQVVVWAAGPGTAPADIDGLADLLEAIGGPALGWS